MRKLVAVAGLLLVLPLALIAQEVPQAELYVGYSYLRLNKSNFEGWDASIDGNINKNLGIVGDVSGYYNSQSTTVSGIQTSSSSSIHSILAGPRVSDPTGKWTPFAQALFGWDRQHTNSTSTAGAFSSSPGTVSNNGFAASLGGGLDYKLTSSADLRIVQVDYMFFHSQGQKQNGARVGAGLLFRLGKKRQ